jgi:hypothetical protein
MELPLNISGIVLPLSDSLSFLLDLTFAQSKL